MRDTLEEQMTAKAQQGLLALGMDEDTAETYAPWLAMVPQFIPLVGAGVGVDNTRDAIQEGRYKDAAIEGGLTLLGELPVVGDWAAAAIKGIRRAPVSLLDDGIDAAKKAAGKKSASKYVDADGNVLPVRSRKKKADRTPEENDSHNLWQREDVRRRKMRADPNYVPRGSPKRLLSPEEIEAQEAGKRARDAERKRAARADPEKGRE